VRQPRFGDNSCWLSGFHNIPFSIYTFLTRQRLSYTHFPNHGIYIATRWQRQLSRTTSSRGAWRVSLLLYTRESTSDSIYNRTLVILNVIFPWSIAIFGEDWGSGRQYPIENHYGKSLAADIGEGLITVDIFALDKAEAAHKLFHQLTSPKDRVVPLAIP
jgi:hypothetical protein